MAIVDLENDETVCPGWKDKINDLMQEVRDLKAASTARVPLGAVIDWWGDPEDATVWDINGIGLEDTDMFGFAQCLGQALTGATAKTPAGVTATVAPDLQGLMTVGQSTTDGDFGSIGTEGGEKEVLLTGAESGYPGDLVEVGFGGSISYSSGSSGNSSPDNAGTTEIGIPAQDAAVAHENMPPYMVMVKIYRYK
jgi:hypothetical protein